MPSWEEVDKSIRMTQNHKNEIAKLSLDTSYYTSKEASLEEMIMQLYKYYVSLSGSVENLKKLVDSKLGGVK